MLPAIGLKSLAAIGRIGPGMTAPWNATCALSTKYVTPEAFQSMRKRCGDPSQATSSGVSNGALLLLRA